MLKQFKTIKTEVSGAKVEPYDLGPEYSLLFSSFLGKDVRLTYLGPKPRYVTGNEPPKTTQKGKRIETSFSDGFPYLVVTEESYEDMVSHLDKRIDIIRMRPNIVLEGAEKAWDEDDWKSLDIGEAGNFYTVSRCGRCTLPCVDLETAERGREPLNSLQKYRRIDKGLPYSPIFGMNAISDMTGMNANDYFTWNFLISDGIVRVGDDAKVLERGEHHYIN